MKKKKKKSPHPSNATQLPAQVEAGNERSIFVTRPIIKKVWNPAPCSTETHASPHILPFPNSSVGIEFTSPSSANRSVVARRLGGLRRGRVGKVP